MPRTIVEDPNECGSEAPMIRIANGIWIRQGVELNPEFEQVVSEYTQVFDFDSDQAGTLINAWVDENTNGLIDSIVDEGPLNGSWILLAINAIYLKAGWLIPFAPSRTNVDAFFTAPFMSDMSTPAHFMHAVDFLRYSDEAIPGYQILRLGFNGRGPSNRLSMIFVLPGVLNAPTVTSSQVVAVLSQLAITRVAVALPKFKFESMYSRNLMGALNDIGLVTPFATGLCIRAGSCGAFVDYVVQKTIIDVNEEGVEAAAVTAIAVAESLPPPDIPKLFQCDRPFQFFIYEESEDVILFEGRVGNPGIPEGAATPALGALHSEPDFWLRYFDVEPSIVSHSVTFPPQVESETEVVPVQPTPSPTPDRDSTNGEVTIPTTPTATTEPQSSSSNSPPPTTVPTAEIATPTTDLETNGEVTVPTTTEPQTSSNNLPPTRGPTSDNVVVDNGEPSPTRAPSTEQGSVDSNGTSQPTKEPSTNQGTVDSNGTSQPVNVPTIQATAPVGSTSVAFRTSSTIFMSCALSLTSLLLAQ